MTSDNRGELTIGLWFLSAITLIGLFISAAILGEFTAAHIVFASVILVLAVSGSVYLLRAREGAAESEKNKRQRIDTLLGSMSDDDLIELKNRLESVDSTEKPLSQYVGDDGELAQRS